MNSTNGNGAAGSIHFDEEMCERYILGQLNAAEQEYFETAYFLNDAFFNRFLAVKDELLDLYSRKELTWDKRNRVERHFESTAPRRKRLAESDDFIRAVTKAVNGSVHFAALDCEVEPKQPTFLESLKRLLTVQTLAASAVLLVLVTVGIWTVSQPKAPYLVAEELAPQRSSNAAPSNLDVVSGNVPSDNNTRTPEKPLTELAPPLRRPETPEIALNPNPDVTPETAPVPNRSVDPTLAFPVPAPTPEQRVAEVVKPPDPKPEVTGARTETVTLSSTSRSLTGRNTASIGSTTQNVVIRMLFGGDAYESYSVRVTALGGATVWRASNVTIGSSARSLAVTVPAGSLTRKDYIVVLEGRSKGGGSETIREYYLHVDRR